MVGAVLSTVKVGAGPGGRGQVAGQVRGGPGRDGDPQGAVARNAADGDRAGQARAGDAERAVGGPGLVQGDVPAARLLD